jgi:hypothetical protein
VQALAGGAERDELLDATRAGLRFREAEGFGELTLQINDGVGNANYGSGNCQIVQRRLGVAGHVGLRVRLV